MKCCRMLALSLCLIALSFPTASAETLGPVSDYDALLALCAQAAPGDIILITGELSAAGGDPLSTQSPLHITSSGEAAVVRELHLHNAVISFSDITLLDTLTVTGASQVELGRGVRVEGASGSSGIAFNGSGELLIDESCVIIGGSGSAGVSIQHTGGEFYAGIGGTVYGGSGHTGGTGLLVSSLTDCGTMMISGTIHGGSGAVMGGNALNLYDLSGNAFVTVTGSLTGGDGSIGGDGAQIVSVTDNASIGVVGQIAGGQGESYGGDALMLMNIGGASSVNLAGSLTGGNASDPGAQPGASLLIIGDTTSSHTRVGDCLLEDGQNISVPAATPEAGEETGVTPLPEITSSVDDPDLLLTPEPEATDTPQPSTQEPSPAQAITPEPAPESTPEPSPELPAESPAEATGEPVSVPDTEPTDEPDGELDDEPTQMPAEPFGPSASAAQ